MENSKTDDQRYKLPDVESLNQKYISLGIILSILIVCCLMTLICSIGFIWVNEMIGGFGNPYLLWP